MTFNILTSDLLISDIIIHSEQNPAAARLAEGFGAKPGEKISIDEEQFKEFLKVVPPDSVKEAGDPDPTKTAIKVPGGSSANVLTTMARLLGKETLNINFVGAVGDDPYHSGDMIRNSLDEAGIQLVPPPESLPKEPPVHNAVSFVIVFPDGQRSIITYPGNAKEILTPEHVTQELVDKSDAVFLQGSLYEKMPHIAKELIGNHAEHSDEADIANTILAKRWTSPKDRNGNKKELWLALPTQAKFAENGEAVNDIKRFPVASANVVLSNERELHRLFNKQNTGDVLKELRAKFNQHTLGYGGKQAAFITAGSWGAFWTDTNQLYDNNWSRDVEVAEKDHVNDLGAGDTAYAGFLAARLVGMETKEASDVGMALAAAKLGVDGPRLPNPRKALQAIKPKLADPGLIDSFERHLKIWQQSQQQATGRAASVR